MEFKNPCSLDLNNLEASPCGFFCAQCTQNVHDFRGLSASEVKKRAKPNMCVIVDNSQVSSSLMMRFKTTMRSLVAAFCLIGLSSNIGIGQTTDSPKEKNITEKSKALVPLHSPEEKRTKKYLRRLRKAQRNTKKRKTYTMGCPSF